MARVADRGHDDNPGARRGLGGARQVIVEVARLVVAAAGDVDDADAVPRPPRRHPLEASPDVVVDDPRRGADLDEDQLGFVREAAVAERVARVAEQKPFPAATTEVIIPCHDETSASRRARRLRRGDARSW